jgi:hypothetical protein
VTQTQSDDFVTLGYFEELIELFPDGSTGQCVGTRFAGNANWKPDRPIGYAGRAEHVMTKDFELQKGMKTVTIKASEAKPFRCVSYLQRTCGQKMERKAKKK